WSAPSGRRPGSSPTPPGSPWTASSGAWPRSSTPRPGPLGCLRPRGDERSRGEGPDTERAVDGGGLAGGLGPAQRPDRGEGGPAQRVAPVVVGQELLDQDG